MPCYRFQDPKSGASAIVCTPRGRGGKRKPCFVRDCRAPGEVLCDWPMQAGDVKLTCDRRCCRGAHSRNVGPDKDYCLEHALLALREKA